MERAGPGEQIVCADVAREAAPAATAEAKVSAWAVPLSRIRLTVAQRMAQAKRDVPHFYVTAEVDMSEAMRLLASLRRRIEQRISVTHLILKAVTLALAQHPRVNGRWADGAVVLGPEINIGLAVAVEEGLIVPVIHGCEKLSLVEIAREATRLVARAKEGKFSGEELRGATFSVSNLGMLDIEDFAAVITPPQAAVLAVGAVKERPVVRGGQLAIAQTMRVTLSCDHRQLDGVEAGRFLETLKGFLEDPLSLVLP